MPRSLSQLIREQHGSGYTLEIKSGSVARGVLLVIVDECARFLLLVLQNPVADFEHELGKVPSCICLPPGAERLHHPRDLTEIPSVAEPVPVILECRIQLALVNMAQPRVVGSR